MAGNKSRESKYELMRIVAMFLIVMYHCVLHSELADGTPLVFAPFCLNQAFAYLVGMWGLTGVGCFFLLTANFQIDSGKVRSQKIFLMIVQTIFWAFVTEIFTICFLRHRQFVLSDAVHALVSPFWGNYWFITAYIGLVLISPFLNKIINNLDDKVYLKLMIVFTAVSPLFSTIGDTRQMLCDLSIAVYYYLLWGYLRRHPGNWIEKNCVKIFCTVFVLSVAAACTSSYVFSRMGKQAAGLFSIFGRASIIQVILAVSLFYMFRKKDIGSHELINIPAKAMLGVYLIHENQLIYPFMWNWILFIRKYFEESPLFMLHLIGCVALVFTCSTILELVRIYLLEKPFAKLISPLKPLFDKFDGWFVCN